MAYRDSQGRIHSQKPDGTRMIVEPSKNKDAYIASLESQLAASQERVRVLESRLAVYENAASSARECAEKVASYCGRLDDFHVGLIAPWIASFAVGQVEPWRKMVEELIDLAEEARDGIAGQPNTANRERRMMWAVDVTARAQALLTPPAPEGQVKEGNET